MPGRSTSAIWATPALEVSFDNARGNQPGPYLGLAGDANGAFHPLWISRRERIDELFTTTVEVSADGMPAPAAPAARGRMSPASCSW